MLAALCILQLRRLIMSGPRGKTMAPKAVPDPSASTSSEAVGGNIPVPDPSTTPDFMPLAEILSCFSKIIKIYKVMGNVSKRQSFLF